MKVKEITIGAVIPTAQYSNLQPSITIEVDDDVEVAKALAMSHIVEISQQFAEPGKELGVGSDKRVLVPAFVGDHIYYDDITHTYTNSAGEKYLSGSEYAKQFEKPFDAEKVSKVVATKFGNILAEDVLAMWELKAEVSRTFGTALHAALELYGKYEALAKSIGKETHLHDHPVLKEAVESFYKGRDKENANYEILVVDHAKKHAGRIDRLLITGRKRCRVQDYKTNADLTQEKIEVYWKQLEFYADILRAHGWQVEGLDIFAWNGKWETFSRENDDIKKS